MYIDLKKFLIEKKFVNKNDYFKCISDFMDKCDLCLEKVLNNPNPSPIKFKF